MLQGETLIAGTGGLTAYSPWFEACGDAATFAIEVSGRMSGSPIPGTMEVRVQTKRLEDSDAEASTLDRVGGGFWWAVASGVPEADPVTVSVARYLGFKELVRFQYLLATVSPAKEFWAHSRMLPPMWEGNCIACAVETELSNRAEATF